MTTIVKPTTDNEAGAVAGVMDYEEDAEAAEQGTSHCLTTSKKNAKPAKSWKYFALETDKHGVVKNQDTPVWGLVVCTRRQSTQVQAICTATYGTITQRNMKQLGLESLKRKLPSEDPSGGV